MYLPSVSVIPDSKQLIIKKKPQLVSSNFVIRKKEIHLLKNYSLWQLQSALVLFWVNIFFLCRALESSDSLKAMVHLFVTSLEISID